jgi:hypothetical protein
MDMISGLEERLVEGSNEGVVHIAELVSHYPTFQTLTFMLFRSKKVRPVREQMTQRALRVQFLIGSLPAASL